jgi:sugar-specific transcriptional regulator TrmB
LSNERILETLVRLGFTETEAKVYVFLDREGPQKARNIAEALNLNRHQLYLNLKKMQRTGIVNASPEYPTRFSAVLFEKILNLLVKTKTEQQKALQESKKELLATWRAITNKGAPKS